MFASSPPSPRGQRPPGQRINRVVVAVIAAVLLLLVTGLWLYLYLGTLEKPYYELQGYRVATQSSFDQFLRNRDHRAQYREMEQFLRLNGVADVTEVSNLLRQGSDWLEVGEPAFAFPPRELWRNIIPTLVLMRDELVPVVGPVGVLSAYRTDSYNRKAGGAPASKHRNFCGLDLVPRSNISRAELADELRSLHARLGPGSDLGIGLYRGVRFHIDTCGYRRW
ncbi:D-Ala-D-Ala carboxypeptidase family metallohydrolase [Microbulbifer sp. 2201CG32-9]|uniref:D-Ala-D-Ala carboxypeptidase family metallohydrolase n=1 Tax=Microbulbifer sp. 2201CG32-9 TaxID=3232309 RepID=UPI00345BED0C